MSSIQNYYAKYVCLVEGTGGTPVPAGRILIRFKLARQFGRRLLTDHPRLATYSIPEVLAEREVMASIYELEILYESFRWTNFLSDPLISMGVPVVAHPGIMKDILRLAEAAVPGQSIMAVIGDTTLHIISNETSSVEYSSTLMSDRDMLVTPVARPYLEGLEKVRVDDDVIRETPSCVVCLENLDHFDNDAAKEEAVADLDFDQQLLPTRLPCSHLFHKYCIVRWLKIQHSCPVCRYSMPTEDEIDEPKFKRSRVM